MEVPIVWLFGGATGVFVAAYLWLLVATGLLVAAPWAQHLDVLLLGAGLVITIVVLTREDVLPRRSSRFAAGALVTALTTVISHAMLWLALQVDAGLLYAMAAARDTSVQLLGLTPLRYVAVSATTFAAAGIAIAAVLAFLPERAVRG